MYAERGDIDDGGGAKEVPCDFVRGRTEARKGPMQPLSTTFKAGAVDKLGHAKLTKDSIETHTIKCKPPNISMTGRDKVTEDKTSDKGHALSLSPPLNGTTLA